MKRDQSRDVIMRLTPRQAHHLYALLDGWMCDSSATTILTVRTSQIGKRLSDAMGAAWLHDDHAIHREAQP